MAFEAYISLISDKCYSMVTSLIFFAYLGVISPKLTYDPSAIKALFKGSICDASISSYLCMNLPDFRLRIC